MNIKKFLPVFILVLSTACFSANASSTKSNLKESVAVMTDEQKQARIEAIKSRVDEIKDMDKSELSRHEKRDMRTELRTMNKEAKVISNGHIYLTLGGVIVIVLVLILIL